MLKEPHMKTYLVVTVTCPDRPGIVERITEIVVRHAANWEDSRMARLGGDFAGIVMISVAPADASALTESLEALGDHETTVTVKATRPMSRLRRPATHSTGSIWSAQITKALCTRCPPIWPPRGSTSSRWKRV